MTIRRQRSGPCVRRAVAAVVVAGLVAACGGDDSAGDAGDGGGLRDDVVVGPRASDEEPLQGGSIVVALDGESSTFLPSMWQGGNLNAAFTIYDPLVTSDADGEVRPYLAESVEPNDDFTAWTVRLRPDVRFHDGTTLDATALRRIFDDHLLAPGRVTQQVSEVVERVDVAGDLTVVYVLTEPNAQFDEWLELPIGWPFSPDAADARGDSFGEHPVGTGPFRFVRWQRDNELVVERNDDYWQPGLPHLDQITFRPIPDESTRVAALVSGAVDAVQGTGLSSLAADVAGVEGVEVVLGSSNNGRGMLFNTTRPPTDDLRVRQALAHAADQEGLIEVAAGDAAELTEPRTQFFSPGSPFHSEAVADAVPRYDPVRAEELLADYVDDPDRSDGKPPGEPVDLTLNVVSTPATVELATAYEGLYEEVGVEVTVRPAEQIVTVTDMLSGEFQATLFRLGDDRSPLGEYLLNFAEPDLVTNFSNFHDQTVADVLAQLRTAGDPEREAELAEDIGLHLAEQVPMQWLASSITFVAADQAVRGLRSWELPDGALGDGTARGIVPWGHMWLATAPA